MTVSARVSPHDPAAAVVAAAAAAACVSGGTLQALLDVAEVTASADATRLRHAPALLPHAGMSMVSSARQVGHRFQYCRPQGCNTQSCGCVADAAALVHASHSRPFLRTAAALACTTLRRVLDAVPQCMPHVSEMPAANGQCLALSG